MTAQIITLREGVSLLSDPQDLQTQTLVGMGRGSRVGPLTSGQRAALRMLANRGGTQRELTDAATAADGWAGVAQAFTLLASLGRDQWLQQTLESDGHPVLSVDPWLGPGASSERMDVPDGGGALVLSRFALLRRVGHKLVLESPRTEATAILHDDRAVLLLSRLSRPLLWETVAALGGWATATLSALRDCGLVVYQGAAEDTDFSLLQWEPHELWFHQRSHAARSGWPWGGTSWARDRFPPLPVQPSPSSLGRVTLPTSDLDDIASVDLPLSRVMEARRSIRQYDDEQPLDIAQLSAFLYRTARVRDTRTQDGYEIADRPYPSGGSLHELQIYVVASCVSGLERGLYRYDGTAHALDLIAPYNRQVAELSAAVDSSPQALLVVSARFGRTMWKYQAMGYALVLKNTGVLMTFMYLVATAMRLAPCALAGLDTEVFARATRLNPAVEGCVGGFALGSTKLPAISSREGQ